jgi:hypothetical protein
MSPVLTVAAVVILTILLGVSLRRQRQIRTTDNQAEARRHTPEAKAQRERSENRRARVRADHTETAHVADEPVVEAKEVVRLRASNLHERPSVTSPSLNGGHRLARPGAGTAIRRD